MAGFMFKNAKIYQLSAPLSLTLTELYTRLAAHRFRPCGPLETLTMGWVSPLGGAHTDPVIAVNNCLMLAMRRQERLLPAAVITELLDERIAVIEQQEKRIVNQPERKRLRDEILAELLPRAFVRSRIVRAYLDRQWRCVVIDAGSDKAAEDVLALLRETLDSFPAKPLATEIDIADRLSTWVTTGAPPGFMVDDSCELRDRADAQAVVHCRGLDLSAPEIKAHLDNGMQVASLGLVWNEELSFTLEASLTLKHLRFSDTLLMTEEQPAGPEQAALNFDTEATLLTDQLRSLLGGLTPALELTPP